MEDYISNDWKAIMDDKDANEMNVLIGKRQEIVDEIRKLNPQDEYYDGLRKSLFKTLNRISDDMRKITNNYNVIEESEISMYLNDCNCDCNEYEDEDDYHYYENEDGGWYYEEDEDECHCKCNEDENEDDYHYYENEDGGWYYEGDEDDEEDEEDEYYGMSTNQKVQSQLNRMRDYGYDNPIVKDNIYYGILEEEHSEE